MYKDEIQGGGLSVLNLPMLSKFRCKGFLPAQIPVNAPVYTYVYWIHRVTHNEWDFRDDCMEFI